jgi:hypothetical protein
VFLAIVIAENLDYRQYNVKNAFIEAMLKERIYLLTLQGVLVKNRYSLRVLRSLYMSQRRFDLGEKYRINENLKLRKKEVFLRGTSCLYTYLPTCVCTCVCTMFALCLH